MFYVAIFSEAPILIATRSMASVKADEAIWQMAQGIHAQVALLNGSKGDVLKTLIKMYECKITTMYVRR